MSWRRLPSFLPNLSLKLQPLTEAQQQAYEKTGHLKELVFKVAPSVNKVSGGPLLAARPGSGSLALRCPLPGGDQEVP